jgi:hypothetical protein
MIHLCINHIKHISTLHSQINRLHGSIHSVSILRFELKNREGRFFTKVAVPCGLKSTSCDIRSETFIVMNNLEISFLPCW